MFNWYKRAQVCYAYLSDVASASQNPSDTDSDFRLSKWFTRGWTLQELLAPINLAFFNRDWVEIGTKKSLKDEISLITRNLIQFDRASVAQKMSWASRRITKRTEDSAYCLMGIFDVNMPPLYGEGNKAFLRLQLEILNTTHDESIFAWELLDGGICRGGLLAEDVGAFKNSGDIIENLRQSAREPAVMTSRGLHVKFESFRKERRPSQRHRRYLMPLRCLRKSRLVSGSDTVVGEVIALEISDPYSIWRRLERIVIWENSDSQRRPDLSSLYFKPNLYHEYTMPSKTLPPSGILITYESLSDHGFGLSSEFPKQIHHETAVEEGTEGNAYWESTLPSDTKKDRFLLRILPGRRDGAIVAFHKSGSQPFALVILNTSLSTAEINLVPLGGSESPEAIMESFDPHTRGLAWNLQSDRLSLKVAEDMYVSASIKLRREDGSDESTHRVELFVENYQRWPAPPSPLEKFTIPLRLREGRS
jgi:hypothetical protein